MRSAATRWRLLELQRHRAAVRRGIELLDSKREALLRALAERSDAAVRARARVARALMDARLPLDRALVEIGVAAGLAASFAQPVAAGVDVREESVLGVRIPRLRGDPAPFRVHYGPGGTCAALDEAGAAFAALLPHVLRLAEEERAEYNLRRGLQRTVRTLNALKIVQLPAIDAEIRSVAAALEEEEREQTHVLYAAWR